ncbi:MAG: DUF5103 domain-containing protein [Bacteroidales bacterium]|nr:DUF5103 domain-containing protein [Bacteroidales bacterium]
MKRFIFNCRRPILLLSMLVFSCVVWAQENICFSPRLKTLQVKVDGQWGSAPVMLLSAGHYVEISFDDLQGNYERYIYTITHCNADWTSSELLTSEYMTGFSQSTIDNYKPSIGTEMKYCHYSLRLPNANTRLLISGNYRVDIFEEGNEDQPVAQACFSIIEPHVGVEMNVSGNTDIDTYEAHQQVGFTINYSGYKLSNPVSELKYVVTQNRRWDTHVTDLQPSLMQVNRLIFNHNRRLIFPAGNEYRRFEMLDPYVPTLRVNEMAYDNTYYHAFLFVDEQRINYLYDEDQNGRYYIRNNDNEENDTESDYFFTHFTLQMPEVPGGNVYVYGDLTHNRIDESHKMEYNLVDHQYELMLPLKQGSYNYMYMYVGDDATSTPLTQPCEGNYHQTENEYDVFVYHRPFGLRYDKLIGFQKLKYKE